MSYQVTFTQSNNPDKQPITVADGTVDNTTSLKFPGKNYAGYGSIIATDFLHLLENFANDTAPTNPVQGQLWFDTAANTNILKVYDGTTWSPAGSLKKSAVAPSASTSGDLWVNTDTSQLYLYSGSAWILVGPQFSAGLQTGPVVESIVDTNNISHNVVTFYSSSSSDLLKSYRISIISKDTFTPKSNISGFQAINQGVNLSSVDSTSTTSLTRYWGTAQQADALLVGTTTVAAANFLRGDSTTVANFPINLRNDGGLTIGANLGFNIGINGNSTVMYSKNSGNSIELSTNNQGSVITSFHLSADAKLGLGANNTNPASTLDIIGGLTVKDDPSTQAVAWTAITLLSLDSYITYNNYYYKVTVAGTTGSVAPSHTSGTATNGSVTLQFFGSVPTAPVPGRLVINGIADIDWTSVSPFDPGGASIQTLGGLKVAKRAWLGGDILGYGKYYINNLDGNSNPIAGSVIQPGSDAAANLYDIGTAARPFRNIYAQTFQGNFSGSFSGSLTGSISGGAAFLQTATTFVLTGDVSSPGVSFNGVTPTGTLTFNTSINQGIITSKAPVTDSQLTDQFLVYRPGAGLASMSKSVFLNHVATVPVGSIFPFAGVATAIPTGYLLCDGSEVQISKFPALFGVLQYTYKAASALAGQATFAIPDLRGRFPLGADNMNNNITVPSKDGSGTLISTSGGMANRVSDVNADNIGASSGSQSITLQTTNLPDHKHNLNDGYQQFYAVGNPNPVVGTAESQLTSITPGRGLASTGGTGQGYGLSDSGSMISSTSGTPLTVMNPYQTINYIIFTGAV
jgi:microcystin-dependent protein